MRKVIHANAARIQPFDVLVELRMSLCVGLLVTPFQQNHAEFANRFMLELIDCEAKEEQQGDFCEGMEIRGINMLGVRGYLLPCEMRELHVEKVDAENRFCDSVDGAIRKRETGKETERENGEGN